MRAIPQKPSRPCRYPGCPALTSHRSGYCEKHLKLTMSQYDQERGSSAQRGYDYRWQRYREVYLVEHPLCVLCAKKDPPIVKAANIVDHIIPHKGDYNFFWDPKNHQPLCEECHNIKSASEDGGFGNLKGRGIKSL